jgi:hypothetical protein
MEREINLRAQRQISSVERHAVYTLSRDKKFVYLAGRSPGRDDVGKGTVIKGLPYANMQGYSFRVLEVQEKRPHRGDSGLTFWRVKCAYEDI